MSIQLSEPERQALSDILSRVLATSANNYGEAYNFIYGVVLQHLQRGDADLDPLSVYWYAHAGAINTGDLQDPASTFIRSALVAGLQYEKSNSQSVQDVSNQIALRVVRTINNTGQIASIDIIIPMDITGPLSVTQGHIGEWGGSFNYWNTPYGGSTVGQIILSDPAEYERFATTAGYALYKTAG